jgi:hypothetical protein
VLEDEELLVLVWKEATGKRLQDLSKITCIAVERLEAKIQDGDSVAGELCSWHEPCTATDYSRGPRGRSESLNSGDLSWGGTRTWERIEALFGVVISVIVIAVTVDIKLT